VLLEVVLLVTIQMVQMVVVQEPLIQVMVVLHLVSGLMVFLVDQVL
jgi:hypothetical protein